MRTPRTTAYYLAAVPFVSIIVNVTFLSAIYIATKDLKAKTWQLGLLGACVTGIYALFCPIFGRLLRGVDTKPKAIAVCLMYILLCVTVPWAHGFWLLLGLVVLLGLAGAIYWPMMEGVACEGRMRSSIRRNLGTYNVLWSVGLTCGTLLAGRLYDLGSHWPFHVCACIALALLVLFVVTPSPHAPEEEEAAARNAEHTDEDVQRELANSFLYLSKVLVFLAYFTFGSLRSLFPKYGEGLGFSATTISVLLFMVVLAQTGIFLLFRNTGFWHYRFWPLLLATAGAGVSFFVIGSTSNELLLVVPLLCVGIFVGCSYFSSLYYSMSRDNAGVESAAWHEMTLGMGSTFGPIVGGLFAQHADSVTAPFVLSGVAAVIGFGITAQFLLRRPCRS